MGNRFDLLALRLMLGSLWRGSYLFTLLFPYPCPFLTRDKTNQRLPAHGTTSNQIRS
jgi:hypothetical protein